MTEPFLYTGLPVRVLFGAGTIVRLPDEVARLGMERPLVVSTAEQRPLAEMLSDRIGAAGVEASAVMHTPLDVTERVLTRVRDESIDGLVAVGGGSTTGLSKALAYRTDLPQIIVPTTYAGSEMTAILGQTHDGIKTTLSDPKVLPEVAIYDVDLTLGLPIGMSGMSGMNALAHAVEALYARDRNPIVGLMAVEGIAALARSLPIIVDRPHDARARSDALYGAWLCGVCLGSVGMALHHKLCHAIGGTFDLPHAETHAVLLPHVVRYNAAADPAAMARIAGALGCDDPAEGLFALSRRVGAPHGLSALGMPESGISHATEVATRNAYWNPRPIEPEALQTLIAHAWRGDRP